MEFQFKPVSEIPDPYSLPLKNLRVADPALFYHDKQWDFFKRLREEAPVHFYEYDVAGRVWSLARYDDIKATDIDYKTFSSEPSIVLGPAIGIESEIPDVDMRMFIAMDPPKHNEQRSTVAPVVAPTNLKKLESTIRERVARILDALPIGETLDWVDRVSIELTTQMLATLLDFPFEKRRKLTRWSDVVTSTPESGIVDSWEQRIEELYECLTYFTKLRDERVGKEGNDLLTMLANGEATRDMDPMEFLGNLMLLIVGGNDTTRNSISGGVVALNRFPSEYEKLRANPDLIPSMVSEIIRWQTPLSYMRRTANHDCEIRGKAIKKNDQILMWYISGNRDDDVFERADEFIIDRANVRKHLAFGFGIHRCMGNRLAEMQLRVLWEEILLRFHMIEVVGELERTFSSFVHGYRRLPVKIHAA